MPTSGDNYTPDGGTVTQPQIVPLRYVPPVEPEKPPDVVEVMLRREAFVMVNGHKLRLVEPPFRFYVDLLKTLVGRGDTGLLTRITAVAKTVAKEGTQAEVETAVLDSFIGESADFICDRLACLLKASNDPDSISAARGDAQAADEHPRKLELPLADWLADNVPAAGMAGMVSAALYVCDVATLRGFFVQAAAQFRRRTKT